MNEHTTPDSGVELDDEVLAVAAGGFIPHRPDQVVTANTPFNSIISITY